MQIAFGRVRRRIAQLRAGFLLMTGVYLEEASKYKSAIMQIAFGRVRRRIAQLRAGFLLMTGVYLEMV